MLVLHKDIKIIIKNDKKLVEIRTKDLKKQEYLKNTIDKLEKRFPNFSFYVTLDSKIQINNVETTDLTNLSNHIKQNIKSVFQLKEFESKKTRNGKYKNSFLFEIPDKQKTLKGIMFTETPMFFKTELYYLVTGRIELGNSAYISKSEKKLGKEIDYQIIINEISEIEIEQEKENYDTSRAELHCHTMYSKNDALSSPEDYLKAFNSNKCHAIAITDHGSVFGFIPFVNQLKGKTDKKLILGAEMYAVSLNEYNETVQQKINELNKDDNSNEIDKINFSIEEQENNLKELRKERDEFKRYSSRKTISEEEKFEALEKYNEKVLEIKNCTENIKELKENVKNIQAQSLLKIKEKEQLENNLNSTNNIDRDHLILLLKTPDEEIDYHGEKLKINKGLVELYKIITKSYTDYFSTPTEADKKMYGKRPVIPYEYLFQPEIRKHFIITSACAFGKHMKLITEGKEKEFREWIKNLDAVEIHPSWNNIFMVEHKDFENIKTEEDVYSLHRKIYKICKEEGVPCIIVSDAHITSKEDRILRSNFKNGYIHLILNNFSKGDEQRTSTDEDFNIETQPYVMSYDDVIKDYTKQGFTLEEIEEMNNNTNKLAEQCINGLDITILPNKLFLPEFPNMNSKEEMPKMVWEEAIKKYSKDGTKETIDKKIKERIEYELELTRESGFETLYMLAYKSCRDSEELGYIVGSRGSVGSMIISNLLKISEVNPLDSHYYCEHCHNIEWYKEEGKTGLDLPDKTCPICGNIMKGDGVSIESHNFVGWIEKDENGKIMKTKIPDIDLNFSENVQSSVQQKVIDLFGKENAIKSGTQQIYQEDALKNDIFRNIPNIQEKVKNEEFDIDFFAKNIHTMRTTGSHPKIWGVQ